MDFAREVCAHDVIGKGQVVRFGLTAAFVPATRDGRNPAGPSSSGIFPSGGVDVLPTGEHGPEERHFRLDVRACVDGTRGPLEQPRLDRAGSRRLGRREPEQAK